MSIYLTGALRPLAIALAAYASNTKLTEHRRHEVIGRHIAALDESGRVRFHAELAACHFAHLAIAA